MFVTLPPGKPLKARFVEIKGADYTKKQVPKKSGKSKPKGNVDD
ncbi:hypothetical protein LYNGBM3L_01770 [Moorena producens 3L]|uniref:Uncharacterized protein n=1 Tax=Moorena producens 3L TaxID=489825 RepID=F4XID8_9CYAN|nr:hypothetical protein LYNGBM3L_01770 [Moorena producens 3L]